MTTFHFHLRAGEELSLDHEGADFADYAAALREVTLAARALREITAFHKLNIAALGNMVPQLHVHIIARFHHDAAWPKPVWGVMPARAYEREALDNLVLALRRKIGCE